jgi:hypothetical protein
MAVPGAASLLKDIEVAYLLPSLSFAGLALNAIISQKTGFTSLKQRIALTFCLLLFAFCITATTVQDRAVFAALWRSAPLYYSVIYMVCGLATVALVTELLYGKLRPSLWKRASNLSD